MLCSRREYIKQEAIEKGVGRGKPHVHLMHVELCLELLIQEEPFTSSTRSSNGSSMSQWPNNQFNTFLSYFTVYLPFLQYMNETHKNKLEGKQRHKPQNQKFFQNLGKTI